MSVYTSHTTKSRVSVTSRRGVAGQVVSAPPENVPNPTPETPTLYERNFNNETTLDGRMSLGGGSLGVFSLDDSVYEGASGKSLKISNGGQQVLHNWAFDSARQSLSGSAVLTTKFRLSATGDLNGPRVGIMARVNTSAGTGYALIVRPQGSGSNTSLRLSRMSGTIETVITTVNLSSQLTADTWYDLKFSFDDRNLKGRVWESGTEEPEVWHLETVDDTYGDSFKGVGYYFFSNNNYSAVAWLDSIVETEVVVDESEITTELGDPFSMSAPNYASKNTHNLTPNSTIWHGYSGPYPTNKFFNNMFLDTNSDAVKLHPYTVKTTGTQLKISFPSSRTVTWNLIQEHFNDNWAVGATETIASRRITLWDEFSVTNRWVTSGAGYFESPLVKGSPYVSTYFSGLTPKLDTIHAILSLNGSGTPGDVTDSKFKAVLNNGQTWIIYFDSEVTINWGNSGGWRILASSAFTGYVRIAYLNDAGDEETLDDHVSMVPIGGEFELSVTDDVATITLTWNTSGTGDLLMLALPHHQDILTTPEIQDVLEYRTLKGMMKAVVGDTWEWEEELTTIQWGAPRSIDSDKLSAVTAALASDYTLTPFAVDPYFGGKSIARSGRLAIIADELGETAKATTIRNNMKSTINAWLNGTSNPNLVYESKWGGICAERGLTSQNADFGAGYYNDHHFHWAYWIYAAACLANEDEAWLEEYKDKVTDLVRDICNPSNQDPFFTPYRNFDWYDGHSWASGLFKFGDGGNQESTSEAANAWYSVYLWGNVIGNDNMKDIARILLASEIRSTQKYWQVDTSEDIYDEIFAANKVVGILWQTKVDYTTFFGANAEYIHEIQNIPVTPISELLLDPDWVTESYPVLISQALDRTFPVSLHINSRGSGYVGANGGFLIGTEEFQIANDVQTSGGEGSGLILNMNIHKNDGRLFEVFIKTAGSGYDPQDVVSLVSPSGGLSGGSGAQIRLLLEPSQEWRGLIYMKHAVIDKATAWTEVQTLESFDSGNSKTNTLYWVATRPDPE